MRIFNEKSSHLIWIGDGYDHERKECMVWVQIKATREIVFHEVETVESQREAIKVAKNLLKELKRK